MAQRLFERLPQRPSHGARLHQDLHTVFPERGPHKIRLTRLPGVCREPGAEFKTRPTVRTYVNVSKNDGFALLVLFRMAA